MGNISDFFFFYLVQELSGVDSKLTRVEMRVCPAETFETAKGRLTTEPGKCQGKKVSSKFMALQHLMAVIGA